MECPDCQKEMTQEDVLVSRTTSPYEEDRYQKMWWCDHCEEAQPIVEDYDEEEV